jgi:6-phosphogluconate dehydrogenase
MKIAVVGLGKMGMQTVQKLAQAQFDVIALGKYPDQIAEAKRHGALAVASREEVLDSFDGQKPILWLMIPSAKVEEEIDQWLKLLPKNSLVVDAGNSNFQDSQKRAAKLAAAGYEFVDVGTSGGIMGFTNGFSLMVGGSKQAFSDIKPVLEELSKPHGSYQLFGPAGCGHFIKMVHNAVEYGAMESLAEGYRLIHEGQFRGVDLAEVSRVWQSGSINESLLNKLAGQAFKENPNLKGIDGEVAETGEARWSLAYADKLKVDMPSIQAAFDVRLASQSGKTSFATKLLAVLRNKFGGHEINKA